MTCGKLQSGTKGSATTIPSELKRLREARGHVQALGELTLAVQRWLSLRDLGRLIRPYPTQAETVRRAADQHRERASTPVRRKLLERFLAWRR